ncbi:MULTISPECIES: C69 family dipeptidase [Thermomonosporaceae]|uniref:C69 family dipeptidase n=1 Tax=Thermomonosporaceae TaxID=2012 RepID=UPI00255AAF3D|nr:MULTISPECIES: C69 family dipeptidase [Thermomonosporaceae]MDL4776431.1 C69 family dipeptidase [Actinomadura xylanilytica]
MQRTRHPRSLPRRTAAFSAALVAASTLLSPMASAGERPSSRPRSSAQKPAGNDKSFAVYIGKNLTKNKRPFMGGFGHEPSSHWIDIVPRQSHPEGATIEVGATGEADMAGKLTKIPQARETARYITSNYSEFVGFPAPLTNGGLNEYGVAARDVWSDSRPELVESTRTPQTGPTYSDLSRIAMERAHSAREAVQIVGDLINKYGYTDYGGNSHMFADKNEGWVLIQLSGGKGLWAAERLGPDDVRVSYPGYINDFPTTGKDDADHMGSPNLLSVAEERGWWKKGQPFDLQKVYGTPFPGKPVAVGAKVDPADPAPYRNPPSLEAEFRRLAPVRLEDVMRIVRDPRWSDDRSGYGHVAELGSGGGNGEMGTLWTAVTASVTAPYIPFHVGDQEVPPEYRQHRYLTHNGSSKYLEPQFAEQEATEYATQTFKRLMYATCSRRDGYLATVTRALEGYEATLIDDLPGVERQAREAYDSGDPARAREVLTRASTKWASNGLKLGDHLLAERLEDLKADGGIRTPEVDKPAGTTANTQSLDMSLRGPVSSHDRMNCDQGGGWAEGGTLARKGHYGDPDDVPDYENAAAGTSGWWFALTGLAGLIAGGAVVLLARRRKA